MAVVPLVAAHSEDFVQILVQVESDNTMSEVAEVVAYHTVGTRVEPQHAPLKVIFNGEVQRDNMTVTDVGMKPMDFVEVSYHG
ncbi:toluene-4-monooxygenase system B family protein [Lentibacillus daqui]|uniref:toluene-4-monooxygenase system B family protein n=1 Tax=Lentibacillus daqui TaxID=2911514 RepID=UPI0022B0CE5E|nr:toluene-4-monooxygenase system B family protein [Lentibacillus daqui]